MGDRAGAGAAGEGLAAALDETVAETSALIAALRAAGGPRERRLAAQLAAALAALAAARARHAQGRDGARAAPRR